MEPELEFVFGGGCSIFTADYSVYEEDVAVETAGSDILKMKLFYLEVAVAMGVFFSAESSKI